MHQQASVQMYQQTGALPHMRLRWFWSGVMVAVSGVFPILPAAPYSTRPRYNTWTPSSANHYSDEVPGMFGAIVGTAGAWAAARLRVVEKKPIPC